MSSPAYPIRRTLMLSILPAFSCGAEPLPETPTTVICPRKSPLGDEISVVKCIHMHRTSPSSCGRCTRFVESAEGARKLDGLGWNGQTRPPSGAAVDAV